MKDLYAKTSSKGDTLRVLHGLAAILGQPTVEHDDSVYGPTEYLNTYGGCYPFPGISFSFDPPEWEIFSDKNPEGSITNPDGERVVTVAQLLAEAYSISKQKTWKIGCRTIRLRDGELRLVEDDLPIPASLVREIAKELDSVGK